jgi:hypothetical protein
MKAVIMGLMVVALMSSVDVVNSLQAGSTAEEFDASRKEVEAQSRKWNIEQNKLRSERSSREAELTASAADWVAKKEFFEQTFSISEEDIAGGWRPTGEAKKYMDKILMPSACKFQNKINEFFNDYGLEALYKVANRNGFRYLINLNQ